MLYPQLHCQCVTFAAGQHTPPVLTGLAPREASRAHHIPTLRPTALCGVTDMVSLRDTFPVGQNGIFHKGLEETIF